jgi:parallel beta-helix repeat protein
MRHRFLGLGIAAVGLLAFPATSFGGVINVFPGDSIQRAVGEAHSGDVIKVHEGIYRESVQIQKNGLTLKGVGTDFRDGTVISSEEDHTKRCQGGLVGICVLPHKDGDRRARTANTKVEGFLIRGFKASGAIAIGANHTTFLRNKFAANDEYGVAAFGSVRTKFLHNVARQSDEAGFYVGDSKRARATLRGNKARGNGQFGFFLRDASHGRVVHNEATRNCLGIGLLNTGAPGGVREWQVSANDASINNHVCVAGEGLTITGTGIGVLGARKNVVRNNSVRGNKPSTPAPLAGGIVVTATTQFGGSLAAKNLIERNRAFNNEPADIVWDGNGAGNLFRLNDCETSQPDGLCS